MNLTDPVADMLTRIRNACSAGIVAPPLLTETRRIEHSDVIVTRTGVDSGEYFTALEMMFSITCARRRGSPAI